VCFFAVRCTGTPRAASSFVVRAPHGHAKGPRPRADPQPGRALAEEPGPLALVKRIQSKEERRPISRVEGAAILGMRHPDRGEEDRNSAARRTRAASSPACSAQRVTRIRFPESVIASRTGLPYTSSRISLPPRDRSSPASATPTASGSETDPLRFPRRIREPSGFPISPRGRPWFRSPFRAPRWGPGTRLPAASGSRAPPGPPGTSPGRPGTPRPRGSVSSSFRISIPSAPCPIAGTETSAGDILTDLAVPPEAEKPRGGEDDRVVFTLLQLPDPRVRFPAAGRSKGRGAGPTAGSGGRRELVPTWAPAGRSSNRACATDRKASRGPPAA